MNESTINREALKGYSIRGLKYKNLLCKTLVNEWETTTSFPSVYLENLNACLPVAMAINDNALKSSSNGSIFIGKDLDIEEIKKQLINKSIGEAKIKVITNIKDIPFSIKNSQYTGDFWFIEDVISEIICKGGVSDSRFCFLFNDVIKINEIKENDKLDRLEPSQEKTRTCILEHFNKTSDNSLSSYDEIPKSYFSKNKKYFDVFHKIYSYKNIDNDFLDNCHYIIDLKSTEELTFASKVARKFNHLIKTPRPLPEGKGFIQTVMDGDNISEYEGRKVFIFIDYKDFYITDISVFGCSERENIVISLFLNNKSYLDGLYIKEEPTLAMARAVTIIYKDENEISKKALEAFGSEYFKKY